MFVLQSEKAVSIKSVQQLREGIQTSQRAVEGGQVVNDKASWICPNRDYEKLLRNKGSQCKN